MGLRYDIEFISADTGEETPQRYMTFGEVETLLVHMKDGDDMVVHCLGQQPDIL